MSHIDHRIDAYLDGELDDAAQRAFDDHVAACRSCREALARARDLWEAVELADRAPRVDLWPGVSARLEARRRRPWTWVQRGLAAAAVAAGVLLGLGLGVEGAAPGGTEMVSSDGYLESSLPSLDELWLQLGDLEKDAES
jgi:anti-sigma factor RsiW